MTRPTNSKQSVVDITAVVPTQRIVSEEAVGRYTDAAPVPESSVGPVPRVAAEAEQAGVAVGLPNLAAVLAEVPGGLGATVCESFTFAGQRWTEADASVSGTPIGLQLAMEQRGLGTCDDAFEMPLQRHGS